MSGFELRLMAVLEEQADGEVHVARLLDTTRALGERYRRRRRAVRLGLLSALGVGLLAVGVVLVPSVYQSHRRSATPVVDMPNDLVLPSITPLPIGWRVSPPLVGDGVPATRDPSVVGADPVLFHLSFDFSTLDGPVTHIVWRSGPGQEELMVQTGGRPASGAPTASVGPGTVLIDVARQAGGLDEQGYGSRSTVKVGSGTGTLAVDHHADAPDGPLFALRWQPVRGVWAQVRGSGSAAVAVRLALGVRLDRVLRCVVPFRLTPIVRGTVQNCAMDFYPSSANGSAVLRIGVGTVSISADRAAPETVRLFEDGTTMNGRYVQVSKAGTGTGGVEVRVGYQSWIAWLVGEDMDEGSLVALAAGFTPVGTARVADWPGPLG